MEEFEFDDLTKDQSIVNFISMIHSAHCDNARLHYYAEKQYGRQVSQMPITPFIYEFFLFNSLYQVDWLTSEHQSRLTFHSEDVTEGQKQKFFIKFIQGYAEKKPAQLFRAFEPLLGIGLVDGLWTKIVPDQRVTIVNGESFFKRILKLQVTLEKCSLPSDFPVSQSIFDLLYECIFFINRVRNNIFHGSKTLGDIYEPSQKRRIEVYDLFLKGLTSLFFLVMGKETAACDFVACPIFSSALPIEKNTEVISQSEVLRATSTELMKVGDSRLVVRFAKVAPPPVLDKKPNEKSSLFYPSAGTDFLTPILLGLPYCTQFYFYDQSNGNNKNRSFFQILRTVKGVEFDPTTHGWEAGEGQDYFDFKFNGIPRRIHWVHLDNTNFLKEDVELAFYFHRGDSIGEGGSNQEWDSMLMPSLLKKIPVGSTCIYLTDGIPGGLETKYSSEVFEINMPFIERGRTYYCGRLDPSKVF